MKFNIQDSPKIKLIIWDLDETFWNGTLSNADSVIEPIESNIHLVKRLSKRGIVNSICSKNDQATAEHKLDEFGILDYFVFRSINWEPKGLRIKNMAKNMNLRTSNILFIDDNPSNIAEAEYISPDLMVATPNVIPLISDIAETLGKDDSTFSRLKQYKILEKKAVDIREFTSNEDFLRNSNIKVCIKKRPIDNIDRIHELLTRSNQLNFTKKRCTKEELRNIIEDDTYETGAVSVADDYGVYGLVGFYATKNNTLTHFFFSCRTMGMGIEQYVYAHIGHPQIEIVQPVSGNISAEKGMPNYIHEVDSLDSTIIDTKKRTRILIKGTCDLQVMASYIESKSGTIDTEFNFVDDNGNQEDFFNHTVNIINSLHLNDRKVRSICETYPFLSPKAFKTNLFSAIYDIVCLSPLMDATLGLYENREHVKIPFGLYNMPLTDKRFWDNYINNKVMTAHCHITKDMLQRFTFEFHKIEYGCTDIANNLAYIYNKLKILNANTKFIIILLSELPYKQQRGINEMNGKECIHKSINDAIRQTLGDKEDVYLLDINKYVKTQADYFDNINHYSKFVYYHMAIDFVNQIGKWDVSTYKTIKNSSYIKALWENVKRSIYKMIFIR